MNDSTKKKARELAREHLEAGDPLGWFEELYSRAGADASMIPWADLEANPNLVRWLDRNLPDHPGRALIVGSGLGDDAQELARRGVVTTAFDISDSAIAHCQKRFPDSAVAYIRADLFSAPHAWQGQFDLVIESYTLQVLPPELRPEAIGAIASFVAPGGTLLVIARAREADEPEGKMPWPLTKGEVALFQSHELNLVALEDYWDDEAPPVRRFRATYRRGSALECGSG